MVVDSTAAAAAALSPVAAGPECIKRKRKASLMRRLLAKFFSRCANGGSKKRQQNVVRKHSQDPRSRLTMEFFQGSSSDVDDETLSSSTISPTSVMITMQDMDDFIEQLPLPSLQEEKQEEVALEERSLPNNVEETALENMGRYSQDASAILESSQSSVSSISVR